MNLCHNTTAVADLLQQLQQQMQQSLQVTRIYTVSQHTSSVQTPAVVLQAEQRDLFDAAGAAADAGHTCNLNCSLQFLPICTDSKHTRFVQGAAVRCGAVGSAREPVQRSKHRSRLKAAPATSTVSAMYTDLQSCDSGCDY